MCRIELLAQRVQAVVRVQLFRKDEMATEPKRPDDGDNIVSLREARARQAEAQARADKSKAAKGNAGGRPEQKVPALLIFLGLLAVLVAFKFLT
jgi:hypothetical protein